jgi:CRP-like cAMP-binding protein
VAELARIETVVVLQAVELFSACTAEQILRISGIAQQRSFDAGEVIYRSSEPADALYCVVRGKVRLSGDDASAVVGPLQTFGVSEILSGRLRTSDAKGEEETLVLAIGAEDFFDLLANNIEIVKALFRQLLEDGDSNAELED